MTDIELHDEIIKQALEIQRLSAGEQARMVALLKSLQDDLRTLIQTASPTQIREINAIIAQANTAIAATFNVAAGQVDVAGISALVAERTQGLLGAAAAAADAVTDVVIFGAPSAEWWAKQSRDTAFRFATQVRQGFNNGETTQKIVQRVVGTKTTPGLMTVTRREATALVNASVQTIANNARLATFRANSDIIKGVRQVSTLDSHTSDICIAYSGCEWDLEGNPVGKNKLAFNGGPPRHFGCRSVLIPVTKTFAELGLDIPEPVQTTLASSIGQVDARTSFEAFLERQPASFADKVLGKGRADLWRAGKITLRDLVSGTGRPLTLEQLRAL